MLKADLHIHTTYSMDCALSLKTIVSRCQKVGINCVAIADHGTVAGALELKKIAPFVVIVAEEILTPFGEVMGLFLDSQIRSPLPVEEAIAQIRKQDGLVCIPHPFDQARLSAFGHEALEDIIPQVDIIEVFNSRSLLRSSSARAWQLANKHGLPVSAGSDAHTASEIGNAFVEMPEFKNKDDFLQALRRGRIFGQKSSPLVHFSSTWARLKKHYF